MARVSVFGAGYAGLVTGVCLSELGHSVCIRDVVPEKIERLQAGELPIYEPGLEELIERNRERLRFTLDVHEAIDGAEFLFVCVGTPPTYSGDADLSSVWTVIDELPDSTSAVLVMKSTVPVGTGEKVRAALDARGLADVGYASNPEFLAEGTAVDDFMRPDRVVVGAFEPEDGDAVAALHDRLDAEVVRTDVASAEMIKLAANAFLGTRISFINEIANVCELVGADVEQVSHGMGLDRRIGRHYLRAGIGFGGSCLVGDETVIVRRDGETQLTTLENLFESVAPADVGLVEPVGLEVLAWRQDADAPEFLAVSVVTRRAYEGDVVEVLTKMGRRVCCTLDHPFVVASATGDAVSVKPAGELTDEDWLPVAQGAAESTPATRSVEVLDGLAAVGLSREDVIARVDRGAVAAFAPGEMRARITTLDPPRGASQRTGDIRRSGAMRLAELDALGLTLDDASLGTAKNGTYIPPRLLLNEPFWRVVGLYIAEGHCTTGARRRRLQWSFHPEDEFDLVEEVAAFWSGLGVKADVRLLQTTAAVTVSSRLLAGCWLGVLGLGANCYEQRIPDLAWDAPNAHKRALLAGLWLGDGSWSYVNQGPSVVLEYGTVSRELAEGILRLLGDLEIVARLRVGRAAKSTRDTYWLTVSGADQVEKLLDLIPGYEVSAVRASLARQRKRIAPTGYRKRANGAWVRVKKLTRRRFRGFVYSLEVPDAGTFVTTGGLVVHNCFPKDISFLKLLAGNSGYHFQLLNAVIEVNELQKRRVVSKLQKHLDALRGKRIALLGLAFKPHTDDLREAPSIVLASRLLAEGAEIVAWDPVADASRILNGVEFAATVLEAVEGADAAVVVTEWPELRDVDWEQAGRLMRTRLVIDGRNLLDPRALRALGFAYEGVGRPSSPFGALPETEEREPELSQ